MADQRMPYGDRPYYALDYYLKQTYGGRLYKLSLDAGMTCPNRDGTLGTGGCIFCSAGGSGDFAASAALSVTEQIDEQIAQMKKRVSASGYIAYFQAYTNTYAPVARLRELFTEAVQDPRIKILSVATRPDCLEQEKIDLLRLMNSRKPVWVELGLQTIHEETAAYIRRGYALPVFRDAVERLHEAGIRVIVHVILGLPGETPEMMYQTIEYLNTLPVFGIKLQLLHVLRGTDLARDYGDGLFQTLDRETYTEIVCECIARLSPDIVVHRLTGDGPADLLISPTWSREKLAVLNGINHYMKTHRIRQGCHICLT